MSVEQREQSMQGEGGRGMSAWARVRPLVFRTIIGAVVAAGLVGVVAVLVGDFGTVALQLILTIVVVIVFALLSWYDADVSSRRSSVFALASIASSLYLLVVGFVKIWIHRDGDGPYADEESLGAIGTQFSQWIGLVLVARAALLHVHLLLNIHRRYPTPVLQVVAKVTVGLIVLLAVLISTPLLFPHVHYAEPFWRLFWVTAILDVLGTVLIPLSNALFRPRPVEATYGGWPAGPISDARSPQAPQAPQPPQPPQPPRGTPTVQVPRVWAGRPGPFASLQTDPTPPRRDRAPAADESALAHEAGPAHESALAYEPPPISQGVLAWPRYVDGTPLPAMPDGKPDFSGVVRRAHSG